MLKFLILTLLSSVLMMLYTGVLHAPEKNAIIDKKNALLLRLIERTFEELDELSINIGEVARTVTENAIAEFERLPNKSTALQAKITGFEQYLELLHQLEEANPQITAQLDLEDVIDKFTDDKDDRRADFDNAVIAMMMEKAGLGAKDKELSKKVLEMSERFMKTFDEYVAMLSANEKASRNALLAWYERFKTEEDVYEKIMAFEGFFKHVLGDEKLNPSQSTCTPTVKYCELNSWTDLKLPDV